MKIQSNFRFKNLDQILNCSCNYIDFFHVESALLLGYFFLSFLFIYCPMELYLDFFSYYYFLFSRCRDGNGGFDFGNGGLEFGQHGIHFFGRDDEGWNESHDIRTGPDQ